MYSAKYFAGKKHPWNQLLDTILSKIMHDTIACTGCGAYTAVFTEFLYYFAGGKTNKMIKRAHFAGKLFLGTHLTYLKIEILGRRPRRHTIIHKTNLGECILTASAQYCSPPAVPYSFRLLSLIHWFILCVPDLSMVFSFCYHKS